jgi:IS5 family transposase
LGLKYYDFMGLFKIREATLVRTAARHSAQRRMRRKLRSPAGRAVHQQRKEIVEPVLGVLKMRRGMRRFRLRGLAKVAVEFTLAATALNLTRIWRVAPRLRIIA